MLCRLIRSLVIVAVSCLAAGGTAAGERVALLIGNSAYAHVPALPNPVGDAAALGASLQRLGFEVVHADNLSYDDMRRVLIDFSAKAAGAEMALVFYAGHGIEIDRQNFLVPVDARLASDRSVTLETIPLDTVLMAVEGATKLKVVLLDACRDNPFVNQMKRSGASRSIGRGLARVEPDVGTLVGFAAKEGTTAADGDGAHSPYTTALLENIEQPGLEISLMFRRIRDRVLETTGRAQEPFSYGSLPGQNIYFVPPSSGGDAPIQAQPVAPQQPPVPTLSEDRVVWDAIKDTDSAAVLSSYISRFPDSLYADFAKARLQEIRDAAAAKQQASLPPPAAEPPPVQRTPPAGSWFVIMGSYKHGDRGKAIARRDGLILKGIDAYLIDTDDYRNLSNGLYAVVIGPYSKSGATSELSKVKRYVGDAYIKSGN